MTCGEPQPGLDLDEKHQGLTGSVAGDDGWPEALAAVYRNDTTELKQLLASKPKLQAARDPEGRTLLHWAAETGAREAMGVLLVAGATWHELDGYGLSAGELALAAGKQSCFEHLVISASDAERAARRCLQAEDVEPPPKRPRAQNSAYLQQRLHFEEGRLLDETRRGVMMGWEAPLMAKHAESLTPMSGADVLNIGFGLGLVDGFLERQNPRSHTIIEAHPDVLAEMDRCRWPAKPGVVIHKGAWQDIVGHLEPGSFDAIFFDTYEESYADMRDFESHLPRLLRPGGRFSFFNGMASYNIFFHAVYCRMAQDDLRALGFTCDFLPVEVGPLLDSTWRGIAKRYWKFETYYLPLAVLQPRCSNDRGKSQGADAEAALGEGGMRWRLWPSLAVHVGDRIDACSDDGEDGECADVGAH